MNNQLDIYVWSIEDVHTIRVEAFGVRLSVAAFSDAHVARNFRAWLANYLPEHLANLDNVRLDMPFLAIWQVVIQRRKHSTDLMNHDCVVLIVDREEVQHGTE